MDDDIICLSGLKVSSGPHFLATKYCTTTWMEKSSGEPDSLSGGFSEPAAVSRAFKRWTDPVRICTSWVLHPQTNPSDD